MATGLSIPVRLNPSGGMKLASGDEQDRGVITLALLSDETENAFAQNEGLGVLMIFDINDPLGRADILAKLRRVFQRFEQQKRFSLRENTIKWEEDGGELILSFKYISLESDDERDFRQKVISSNAGTSSNG